MMPANIDACSSTHVRIFFPGIRTPPPTCSAGFAFHSPLGMPDFSCDIFRINFAYCRVGKLCIGQHIHWQQYLPAVFARSTYASTVGPSVALPSFLVLPPLPLPLWVPSRWSSERNGGSGTGFASMFMSISLQDYQHKNGKGLRRSCSQSADKHVPCSIPQSAKSPQAAASLSRRCLVRSIWLSAL